MGRRTNKATIATETPNRRSHQRMVSGQILPANKLVNVRRRAERAMGGEAIESIVTCPASRHVMMMADALAANRKYHMLDEEPEHCAGSIYSVLESLWKARAEIKRLRLTANGTAIRHHEDTKP
jgi:hypothetical protein